ncbi:glycoside hydrolase [Clathrospora elynae]|uniref:glucan endo-1,3-beta-D-glucosidase n=1 Tax=Clathrospora elynae TaxID=706981 RepID=A0A6A5SP15_9PLEO|nr:glycoside hydrolase [Clathrospora elynae]
MIRLLTLLLLLPCFAQAATKIYTGFNYGAFWSVDSNVKQKADFLDGFNLAKNLTTPIPFDSARLFTCRAGGTLNDPISAFDAAVESKTNLLLGFWITPGEKGDSPDENVNNEMIALEKGFKQHGQALSDLIIGLSVGNEDVYRSVDPNQIGVSADVVSKTIEQVKKRIATSSFAQYMKDKPIGHVDTAQYAVVDNADFIGMTAYPYWNNDSIEKASTGFQGSLESVKQRAGNRPVWIGEMGWPFADSKDHGEAVASAENLQKYWTEVGCAVIGKYTTFWFELLWDGPTDGSQPDFGLMDITSRKARIKDLSCGAPVKSPPAVSSSSSQVPPANSSSAPPNYFNTGKPGYIGRSYVWYSPACEPHYISCSCTQRTHVVFVFRTPVLYTPLESARGIFYSAFHLSGSQTSHNLFRIGRHNICHFSHQIFGSFRWIALRLHVAYSYGSC